MSEAEPDDDFNQDNKVRGSFLLPYSYQEFTILRFATGESGAEAPLSPLPQRFSIFCTLSARSKSKTNPAVFILSVTVARACTLGTLKVRSLLLQLLSCSHMWRSGVCLVLWKRISPKSIVVYERRMQKVQIACEVYCYEIGACFLYMCRQSRYKSLSHSVTLQ